MLSWLPQLSVRTHSLLYKKKRHVLKILHVRKCVVLVSYASIPPFSKFPTISTCSFNKVLHIYLHHASAVSRTIDQSQTFFQWFWASLPTWALSFLPKRVQWTFSSSILNFKKHEQLQLQCRVEMQPALGRWRSPWASDRITPTRPVLILLTLVYFILLPLCWREVLLASKL